MSRYFSATFLCLFVTFLFGVDAFAVKPLKVTYQKEKNDFTLVGNDGKQAVFIVDANDAPVVTTAVEAVIGDIEAITGRVLGLQSTLDKVELPIIVGTLGQSELVDRLVDKRKIAVDGVADKWEAYGLAVVEKPLKGVNRALVIYGSTPRGTAYGVFELSRLMGVSPWIWWADVTPEKQDALYVSPGSLTVGEPSVKWRGIFINDEDFGLMPWAAKGIDAQYNNIGPNTYAKVMELLLRLRANVLWPAMHMCSQAFWDNKDNLPVAKKYDIALGSSHCEQMLRDNEWEWRHYENNYGTNENWNYVTNKEKIQKYWEERVEESKGFSAMYTLGMRGVHDWGISGYPTTEDKVRGLTEIIDFQRSLIAKHLGDPTGVPQIFIPYKEVLEAYNAGLQIPEDVIITWVDDNHGYVRQLPSAEEQKRSGGHGMYYHLSYWGTPADYLWLASSSPSLISYELVKSYDNGVKDLWVINVGDIKPAEEELEFCMDLAWDVDAWQPEKAYEYNRYWAAKTFGEELADAIADIKMDYYRLAAGGKPEHVFGIKYNNTEKDRRIAEYKNLADKVDAVSTSVPARLKDAFFEIIEYPVKGAYLMNAKTLRASQSLELAAAGHREDALKYAEESQNAFNGIVALTDKYNKQTAGGKWDGIMSYKPRDLAHFGMPQTATPDGVAQFTIEQHEPRFAIVQANDFITHRGDFKEIKNLGVSGTSMTVWPLNMKSYGINEIGDAPYIEYTVPVKRGLNKISAHFLPTFPIHSGDAYNVALSINDKSPEVSSLVTWAMEGKWHTTVMQGFNDATLKHMADEDGTVKLRVSLLDPGLVLSRIFVEYDDDNGLLTSQLLVNPDFEYDANGKYNITGETSRGIPSGWTSKGDLNGNSYGINNDGTNFKGNNLCWINSSPMPADYELSQTISPDKLDEGYYLVRCMLWVEDGAKSDCRLFANNYVQYFGKEEEYKNIINPGEVRSFAGHEGGRTDNFTLREMAVVAHVDEGEPLTVGIRSSNKRQDGTPADNNSGWFKVDNFRIDRLETIPTGQSN
ncbi:MAG: glycosyl hydrolase 115 family protein [Muribaculaceae bacterium]|nr:glycosyl hydrolase 115 family protein [Muribaculaceae bacterium]